MTPAALAERLVATWPAWAARHLPANHCITAAAAVAVIAAEAGIGCEVTATFVLAANRQALGLLERGVPRSAWPEGPWSVGASPDVPEGSTPGYSGHVVAVLEGRVLVDLAAGQMSRPDKAILVPASLWCDAVLDSGEWVAVLPRKAAILWAPHPDRSWRRSADWRRRVEVTRAFLDEAT